MAPKKVAGTKRKAPLPAADSNAALPAKTIAKAKVMDSVAAGSAAVAVSQKAEEFLPLHIKLSCTQLVCHRQHLIRHSTEATYVSGCWPTLLLTREGLLS